MTTTLRLVVAKRQPTDPELARRHNEWSRRVGDRLPEMLKELLNSDVYGLTTGRPLPPKRHGIYLLSENGEPR